MPRARARFTESDVSRVLRAAAKAHIDVRVRIEPNGAITIATGKAAETVNGNCENEWDEVYGDGDDQTAARQ